MEIENDKATTAMTRATTSEQTLPFVEKYRPKRLEDLVAHEDIVSIITKLIDSDNLPHLLLYGPPGTGKTSTIVAAAKRMYGPKLYSTMTLELNASDARGIDVVRNEIKEFAGTRQLFFHNNMDNKNNDDANTNTKISNIKLIILDEADAMTSDAQNALRRTMEQYTKNARFCLICNYVSKIIPALQSRCTRFRFAPLQIDQIRDRLLHVATEENIDFTPKGLEAILHLSGGDMRRVLNILQSTSMSFPCVDDTSVYLTTGAPLPSDIDSILHSLMNDTFQISHEKITLLCKDKGYAMMDILSNLTNIISCMDDLPPGVLAELLDGMSNVEYRLAFGTDESVQCASLVGVFVKARHLIQMSAKQ